ncbi:MAG: hypothetical protein AVDCRST_MAG67-1009, partial [uncultured Solirubrobacteraceae bacterium]
CPRLTAPPTARARRSCSTRCCAARSRRRASTPRRRTRPAVRCGASAPAPSPVPGPPWRWLSGPSSTPASKRSREPATRPPAGRRCRTGSRSRARSTATFRSATTRPP